MIRLHTPYPPARTLVELPVGHVAIVTLPFTDGPVNLGVANAAHPIQLLADTVGIAVQILTWAGDPLGPPLDPDDLAIGDASAKGRPPRYVVWMSQAELDATRKWHAAHGAAQH